MSSKKNVSLIIGIAIPIFMIFLIAISHSLSSTSSSTSIVIDYKGIKVNAVIDKPESNEVDVLLAFHGTTTDDSKILAAAETMLKNTKKIIKKNNVLIISVAYPEEGMLFGDNIREAEAALLWTKYNASEELGVKINRIYLIGHSQGGYLVTRLNTMHETDGVIANGAGPIDLSYECKLDEAGQVKGPEPKRESVHNVCNILKSKYGSVYNSPAPYRNRSLINFTSGYKSRILFVQGMNESGSQMTLYPEFKAKVSQCTDCARIEFLEAENSGHQAAFKNDRAIRAINNFLFD